MVVQRESVQSAEVREFDYCGPDFSALFIKFVYLLIINVCKVSLVFLGSSMSAWLTFCLSPGGIKPRVKECLCFPVRWFSQAVCAFASASECVGQPLSTKVFFLCM